MKTNFFTQAAELMPNFDLQFGIMKKEEVFSVIITLKPLGASEEDLKTIGPIVLTNTTAEELDEQFFDKIKEPLLLAAEAFDNIEEFKKNIKKVAEKPTAKKPAGKEKKVEATKGSEDQQEEDTDEKVHDSLTEETEEQPTPKTKAKAIPKTAEKKENLKPTLDAPTELNADGHLKKGNELYAKKDFDGALKSYTSAFELEKSKDKKKLIQESISACNVKIKAKKELFGEGEDETSEEAASATDNEETEEEEEEKPFDPNDL